MEVSPLAVILVKNGSRGDRLLFKYPFGNDTDHETMIKSTKRNPFSLGSNENSMSFKPSNDVGLSAGKLTNFSDKVMSNLFAVNKKLCGAKFELKVNDVRFVGHPINLEENKENEGKGDKEKRKSGSSILLINIVFALKATISHDIVNCYHDLSRRLGIAISFEEQRCHFLSQEAKIMLVAHDEASQQPESSQESSFQLILSRSLVANHLKKVYEDLCSSGKVHLRLNNWIDISFCLPQKISYGFGNCQRINYKLLLNGLRKVKPYHTLLLLADRKELLKSLSADASPALRRLLHVESPINPFYTLAADADLTLPQVLLLAGHLVYWGKGTIIYPVCNTNTYVLSPHVPTGRMTKLVEKFQEEFPGSSYHQTLSEYSLPISLRDKCTPMCLPFEQQQEKEKLLWLLKHGLLQQLHTYIYLTLPCSIKTKTGGISSLTASARGILATVAEVTTEKFLEEIPSESSSIKDEIEWHEETKENVKVQNLMEIKNSPHKGSDYLKSVLNIKEPSVNHFDEDLSNQSVNNLDNSYKKCAFVDDVNSFHPSLFTQKISSSQQTFTPSESDPGSACSDERSISPAGVSTSMLTEEGVMHALDTSLTPTEREMVMQTEAARNLEDLKLFTRLCPYFRGEHHMEEIMYHVNIHRSQLLEILDKFRSVLITTQRIDPSISFVSEA